MDQAIVNALLIVESQKRGRNFAARLEHLGCKCWVATTREEVRALLRQRPFRLVLRTRLITDRGPLMELLKDSERVVFYSFPVANRFLWFQALPEFVDGEVPRPLGPRDLMRVLAGLIARHRSHASESTNLAKNSRASERLQTSRELKLFLGSPIESVRRKL